jgi:ATP phosphoribosyltransferase
MTQLTIALSKGRIYKEALPLLKHADIYPLDDPEKSRKLILDTNHDDIKLVVIRATDVPVYVNYGAADVGITGKDVLMEYDGSELYEPLDLKIAPCKMMVAGLPNVQHNESRLRIATKYINIAHQYYNKKGIQIEAIKLYGAMELAPIAGLADYIVDLVDTGNTLKANGLVPLEHIADISSRLVINKASMKTKYQPISQLIRTIQDSL